MPDSTHWSTADFIIYSRRDPRGRWSARIVVVKEPSTASLPSLQGPDNDGGMSTVQRTESVFYLVEK
jgi:hypothetical protein